MLSAGMLTDLASAMIVRRRGFISGSPPPPRAATVNSLMMRVKILPRLASAAPFLCLIVCHLEWPDIVKTPRKYRENARRWYHRGRAAGHSRLARQDHPHVGARVPRSAVIVAQHGGNLEPRRFQTTPHLGNGQRAKSQREAVDALATSPALHVFVVEDREPPAGVLAHS